MPPLIAPAQRPFHADLNQIVCVSRVAGEQSRQSAKARQQPDKTLLKIVHALTFVLGKKRPPSRV